MTLRLGIVRHRVLLKPVVIEMWSLTACKRGVLSLSIESPSSNGLSFVFFFGGGGLHPFQQSQQVNCNSVLCLHDDDDDDGDDDDGDDDGEDVDYQNHDRKGF